MTAKKPKSKHAKSGPKGAKKKEIDDKLRELYLRGGITYTHAAQISNCSNEYASLAFKKFGVEIAENKEPDEDWYDKNDRVRDRALEGLSRQIKKSDENLSIMNQRLKNSKEIQVNILPNACEKIIGETSLREFVDSLKPKEFFALYGMMGGDLNMWKNYGYLVETINNNIRAETILQMELQQQYDSIEILPPPSEVLDATIEKRIAEKQGLTQPTPEQQIQEQKKKK